MSLGPWFGGGRGRGTGTDQGWFDPFGLWSSPFSTDIWDYRPFDNWGLWDINNRGGRRQGGGGGSEDDPASVIARTNVDWRETDNAHIFRADLPGVRKEEVKVQVEDGNTLVISGEHTKEEEDKNDTWHRWERRRGSFVRRFRLPENAKVDEVKCTMENGVLTVNVPKNPELEKAKNVRAIDIA